MQRLLPTVEEQILPDNIVTIKNLTGSVTSIIDNPDSPDSNWITTNGSNLNVVFEVDFATPIKRLYSGTQTGNNYDHYFKVLLKKNAELGNTVNFDVRLFDDTSERSTLISETTITSITGVVYTTPIWSSSLLLDKLGRSVRLKITQTGGGSGGGQRRWIEIGAIRWYAKTRYPEITLTV